MDDTRVITDEDGDTITVMVADEDPDYLVLAIEMESVDEGIVHASVALPPSGISELLAAIEALRDR